MNFFEHQERARRSSTGLVFLYLLAVASIIAALYAGVLLFLQWGPAHSNRAFQPTYWQPQIFLTVCVGVLSVVFLGTLYKCLQLGGSGEKVATLLGGELLAPHTTDPDERRLLNVVEEMAIASGIAVPPVYLLRDEGGINAFAAGTAPTNGVIGVTAGCLHALSRDELQGVIAHEFSHIFNGDMRLNIRLMGVVHGIYALSVIGYTLFRFAGNSRTRGKKSENNLALAFLLLGVLLMVVGWIGVFFGRLIKSGVSRQREFLADASAVQFTRNTSGIAGALRKIGAIQGGSRITNHHAEEASHLFFSNGLKSSFVQLMATHPPLTERIARIEGKEHTPPPPTLSASPLSTLVDTPFLSLTPAGVIAQVGNPSTSHLTFAAELRNSLPATVSETLLTPAGGAALVLALFVRDHVEGEERALTVLARLPQQLTEAVTALLPALTGLGAHYRLPLFELALRPLSDLPPQELSEVVTALEQLAHSDNTLSLFELAALTIIRHRVAPQTRTARFSEEDVLVLLSALSSLGGEGAYESGRRAFGSPLPSAPLAPSSAQVERALVAVGNAPPKVKERIVRAAVGCVAADGTVAVAEGELLRAVSEAIGCPLPPLLPFPSLTGRTD